MAQINDMDIKNLGDGVKEESKATNATSNVFSESSDDIISNNLEGGYLDEYCA